MSPALALADRHFEQGRLSEALSAYQAVLAESPRHVHALHRLALAHFREGKPERAREFLDRAIQEAPTRADLWEHRGLLAAMARELAPAEACYRRALALSGGTASLHRNLADVFKLGGRMQEAREHYERALDRDPTLHHAIRRLAALSTEAGRHDEAVAWWRRACGLNAAPGGPSRSADTGASRGSAAGAPDIARDNVRDNARQSDRIELLKAIARLGDEAVLATHIAQLRAEFATDIAALEDLSFALNQLHRYGDAYDVARHGLTLDAASGELHHNAGYASNMLGAHARMRHHAVEAARYLPDDEHVQFNVAVTQLREGDFLNGWRQYRWHERLAQNATLVRPNFPEWLGEPLAGKRFLLIGEQGLGDQLQSLRYISWLQRQGASVDVWVDEAIGDVAACARGVHRAWTAMPREPYDFWGRMFRVPEPMRLTLDQLPLAMPYLGAPADQLVRWRERLDRVTPRGAGTLRVGLVWAGNPAYEFDRYRSLALRALQPVLAQRNVVWFSLQKGAAQDELAALPDDIAITLLGPEIERFTDTLAIVESLDLVLTVDTSVAHLAGAAGVPVWILLPTCTDWRWMTGRADSPWYPSARLFRQRELGRRDEVIEEVGRALAAHLAGFRA
ncbi:tetratricopeptide repeat protein [Paraburkholderia acidisoli]|uniref:Tetratricopeptide repeat protein n=1 Tax=Paraburkholderia acidisoli TaxID=2571748 RepID=A0A7Z2JE77_9BURK|nr:tetratricopeptide repeat protein [Paraburkholderia acidisoli]QGZ62032.1 tetratricopeptide repeat protein [Paraburkholderia acidisoli]